MMNSPAHVFTVDVEEWFHVTALAPFIERSRWSSLESRVEWAVFQLLELLGESHQRATFFVLGWVADRNPELVRRIAGAGHEIASHGWWHQRVTAQTPEEFGEDVRSTRMLLEDICGVAVTGYRAPSFSVVPGRECAFDQLLEAGYLYDSSIFPIRRSRGYGYPGAPDVPHRITRPGGALLELPMTPLRVGSVRVPAAGGAYFRHLPYWFTRAALRQRERRGERGVFYVHPWEVDTGQPRLSVPWLTRARHYGAIARAIPRLRRLLAEFRFTTAADALGLAPSLPIPAEIKVAG